jgi:two-component system sensor histidine kinase KdpD
MTRRSDRRWHSRLHSLWPYIASFLLVCAAALGGAFLRAWVDPPNVSMVFLAAVLVSAVVFGLGPSLFSALLGTLAYNFFFLQPLYSLTVRDPANVVALVFLLLVAVLTSNLTARLKGANAGLRQRAEMNEALFEFSRKLTGITRLDDLVWATAHQMALMLKARVVLLLPQMGELHVVGGFPPDDQLSRDDREAAELAWLGDRPTGHGTNSIPLSRRLFLPMRSVEGAVGVVGIDRDPASAEPDFDADERRLVEALANLAGIAVARLRLAETADNARLAAEAEELRLALLSAVSHDFRTPLASIIGSASSLRSLGDRFDRATRDELLDTIREEAERLNGFVGNVLDMTRIESGALHPNLVPVDLAETINGLLREKGNMLAHHRVDLNCPIDLPLIRLDPILFRHALGNILENCVRLSPAGSTISIDAAVANGIEIRVADEGPGFAAGETGAVFERFRKGSAATSESGTGLGLAIAHGFVMAMGGWIGATNRTDRPGAVFTLHWPPGSLVEARVPDDESGNIG